MTNISQEIHNLVQQLSIPDRTALVKEMSELTSRYNMSIEMAEEQVYKKYYGDQYKNILKQEIINEQSGEISKGIEERLDKLMNKLEQTESNLTSLLQSKTAYYVKQGYDEDKALEIAKAELIFDAPETSKLEYSIKSHETTSGALDDNVELLSRL